MKIGQKLILIFLLISALVWIFGFISVNLSRKSLERYIGESYVSLAVEVLDKIDRHIYSRIEEFQSYCSDKLLQEGISASNQEFEKLEDIEGYITKQDNEWVSAPRELLTPFMLQLINNSMSFELKEKLEFYKKKYSYEIYGEIFATNKYGANVFQTRKTSDYRQNDEKWWQEAQKNGLYIEDVSYDDSSGVYSTAIGIRIDDKDGDFIGVMKVVLNIEDIINIINSIKPSKQYPGTYFKLVNKDGKLLYSSKKKGEPKLFKELSGIDFFIFNRMENQEGFFTGQEAGEEDELFAYARSEGYRDFKGLGWILIVEYQAREIFGSVIKLKDTLLLTSFILTLFAVLLGIFFARSISGPIIKLKNATIEIAKGKLDTRIEIKRKDEIGILADSFNKMTSDMQKTTTSIEKLNKEIAERKKAEEERERTIKELKKGHELLKKQKQDVEDSRRAIKNTAEDIMESKEILEYQKKSLEDVNKELDDFTYIVSHDLKEPLRSIDAYSKFIIDDYKDKLSEEGRHYLERVRANTERMKKLIEDLLEISRLKKRGSTIEEVETEELISEVKMRLEYAIKQKGVEIIIKDKLPKIFCDRVRLTEIFLNLISNAIKFNDKQKPVIEIGYNDQGDIHKFYIKDNGIGIKEEYFEKIFEIFQRLGKREDVEGTGAGLTIVKKIIQLHKGNIWLESKPGEGSVFYFTIPKDRSVILGKKLIGEILLERKLVTEDDIKKALEEQQRMGRINKGEQDGRGT